MEKGDLDEIKKMVQQLSQECKFLREEMNEMKLYTSYYIKKDILKFLKTYCLPIIPYKDWYKGFLIDDSYLSIVFANNLTEGIKKCICDLITSDDIHSIPLRSFKEKPGTLYIYSNEIGWEICSSSQFSSWIDFIMHSFLKVFILYETSNKLEDEVKFDYFIKISGTKIKKERQNTELKKFVLSLISVSLDSCFVKVK